MLPNIRIQIQNGRLGQVGATDDGVAAMLLQGVASGDVQLWTPYVFYSLADAIQRGFSATYDGSNACRCYKHLKEFYDEAGLGAELHVMLAPQTITYPNLFLESGELSRLRTWLLGANGRIKMMAITRSPLAATGVANGMSAEIGLLAPPLNAFGNYLLSKYAPIRVLVEARDVNFEGNATNVLDLKTLNCPFMGVVVGDTRVTSAGSAVGLALGRLAKVPVQRNLARVKDGNINVLGAYYASVRVEDCPMLVEALDNKGFICFRKHIGRAGYFLSDDPTTTLATDDFNKIARGRVIDKVVRLAYQTYLNYLNDEIKVNAANGRIEAASIKSYQAAIERVLNLSMTANNEISSAKAIVDPMQNVLSTNKICVEIVIVPVGYAREIVVQLGFDNPQISNSNA
jgi:Protein of unknown function (DUF2586)